MNITTYKQYPKNMKDIMERIEGSMNSCKNLGQLASTLSFNAPYIEAVRHFSDIKGDVSDKMIKAYFKKANKTQHS